MKRVKMDAIGLIDKLRINRRLEHGEWVYLINENSDDVRKYAAETACVISREQFENNVYIRGIIEFSNICGNDCLYCGIRRSNRNAVRYRLTGDEILECCKKGYELGYRTFVFQSGEDAYWTDERLADILGAVKKLYPDCAVTLSIGERSADSYKFLFDSGADRYLLRHETADPKHYSMLHPKEMSFRNRINCLYELRNAGFQTGCGMMVGTPFQTAEYLAGDMEFMSLFKPEMAGIGPFIPHRDTPFGEYGAGSVERTLLLLSLTRIMLPEVLLPSTTALGTLTGDGRLQGILAGCNVVMPNLSPQNVREKYMLYDNKQGVGLSAEEDLTLLKNGIEAIGYRVVTGRGDHKKFIGNEV